MNYSKIYDDLIKRAQSRTMCGYMETHHIVPRCMNGSNSLDNLVELTAREHFIAHILLVKIFPEISGLIYAVNMMTRQYTTERCNNRMYGWLKEKYNQVNSGKVGSMLGKKHSPEAIQKMKESARVRYGGAQPEHLKGKSKSRVRSQQELVKMVETRRANSDAWHSDETIEKIRDSRQHTSEHARQSASDRRRGQVASEDTKQKMSESHKGKPAWNKGRAWSDEEKKKRSDSVKRTKALKKLLKEQSTDNST